MSEMITPSWQDAAERTMKALEISDTKVADLVTQLDAATARAESANKAAKEWQDSCAEEMARAEQAEAERDTQRIRAAGAEERCEFVLSAKNDWMDRAMNAKAELNTLTRDLETAQRALEFYATEENWDTATAGTQGQSYGVPYLKSWDAGEHARAALATITAPDGQQVTADGHVAREDLLEISNEARPSTQFTLDDLKQMRAEIEAEAAEISWTGPRLDRFQRMANGEKLG